MIETISDVLIKRLDDDVQVPLYGFGDSLTTNKKVFLLNSERPCKTKQELLNAYSEAAAHVTLSGPTSFAPIIYEAMDVVQSLGKYHVLVIIADGMMDDVSNTVNAIVAASYHPLSIVMVGIGDGPWSQMEEFDDELPQRQFDNFQFTSFTQLEEKCRENPSQLPPMFALAALQELPDQYKFIKKSGMLQRDPIRLPNFTHRLYGAHHFAPEYPMYQLAPPVTANTYAQPPPSYHQ